MTENIKAIKFGNLQENNESSTTSKRQSTAELIELNRMLDENLK